MGPPVVNFKFLILFFVFLLILFLNNIVNGWNKRTIAVQINGVKISKNKKYRENWIISCPKTYKIIGNKTTIKKENDIKRVVFLVNYGLLIFLLKIALKNKKDSIK